MKWAGLTLVVVLTAQLATAGPVQYVDLREGWTSQTQGAWRIRHDHRDLLTMHHPWQPSEQGGFALAWRDIEIPADWVGPVYLSFYCSDDYHTDDWRPDGSWLTASGFIDHRFKRILVNGDLVVWDQDVSDPVHKGASPRYRVRLLLATPGQTVRLGLLTYDVVPSTTVLPRDFYQPGETKQTRAEDPNASRFMTNVYWGDLALEQGENLAPPLRRPVEVKVRAVHDRRWPTPPFGDGWTEDRVRFELSIPLGLPETGFPLRQGIPLPAGKIDGAEEVRFETPEGKRLEVRKTILSRWPDESIRWLLTDMVAQPDMDAVVMRFTDGKALKPGRSTIALDGGNVVCKGNPLQFTMGLGEPIATITPGISAVELTLEAGADRMTAAASDVWIDDDGPSRFSAMAEGHFEGTDAQRGRISLQTTVFEGLPFAKLRVTFVNDTAVDILVSSLALTLILDDAPPNWRTPSGDTEGDVLLMQHSATERTRNDQPVSSESPAFLAWTGGAVAVKHFRERFPKSIRGRGNRVEVDLVAAGDSPLAITPGEALTHDLWLALGISDGARLAAAVHRPPVLENPAYYCATGVLGPARTHDGAGRLRAAMERTYAGKTWADLGQQHGVRDFPDSPYMGKAGAWSNNYYERMLNLWSEWFMGGGREWYDRALDVSRHILDTAVVHAPVPGKDWLGAIHGPGVNHVAGPWNPTLRAAGLGLMHKVTGDLDGAAAFHGASEFCLRTGAGLDGGSIRQHAGPFDTICDAYMETGDPTYLDHGAQRVEAVLGQIDRRRGVWPDTHGSQVYRGNVPWMAAQLARPLYRWYHATGDVEAAQVLVGLAESIICENTDWDEAGAVYGYSHNPHYAMTANYDLAILPMIFAAYELSEDTFFLDAGKAQWQRWSESDALDSVLNVYWNTPWLMWYLHEYGITAPTTEAPATDAEQRE